MNPNSRIPLSRKFEHAKDFCPEAESEYICGVSTEDRSEHFRDPSSQIKKARLWEIQEKSEEQIDVLTEGQEKKSFLLHDQAALETFISSLRPTLYLDITGLSHHVWAPILRSILKAGKRLEVIYVEPEAYSISRKAVAEGIYDLSERIGGIRPLPGFASIFDRENESIFIPLLGFEGARFQFAIDAVTPKNDKIFPIVGLPGFKPDYPFHTYLTNKEPLRDSEAWKNIQYAAAHCPFEAFDTIDMLVLKHKDHSIKVAMIGTKPHALAAVLYKIVMGSQASIELIYDFPIRKPGRTKATERLHLYRVSDFLACNFEA